MVDGGSSSVPLSPPPSPSPQVYLRRAMPPPPPGPRAPPPPKANFFRPSAPIPIFTARAAGQRSTAPKPPVPPPTPVAAQATPPPAPTPAADQQLPARPPQPPLAARSPQQTPADGAVLPPAPEAAANGQQQMAAPRVSHDESNGREISRAEVKKEETAQGHDMASTTAPVKVVKRPKNLKVSKQNLDASNGGTIEGDAGPLYSSNHYRYDNSLSLLTKKFVSLLQEAEDGTLDLNKAAEMLEVQKRRIYDITNVLEGVDLIEKTLKNMIRLKGFNMSKPKEQECQIAALKEELETLYKEDDRLENEIRETQEKLEALELDKDKRKLLYVLKDDIDKIPHFKDSTLIAINAPRGTSIEVLDPRADRYIFGDLSSTEKHYKMVLRSAMGPIDCYLISDRQEVVDPDQQVVPDNPEHAAATGSAQDLHHMDCDSDETARQMDCDPSEAVQQMDSDQSQAPKEGESNAALICTAAPSRKHEPVSDILRIVPSHSDDADADYWFASDPDVSVTQTWGS